MSSWVGGGAETSRLPSNRAQETATRSAAAARRRFVALGIRGAIPLSKAIPVPAGNAAGVRSADRRVRSDHAVEDALDLGALRVGGHRRARLELVRRAEEGHERLLSVAAR